jgi:hypothetical protein
MEGTRIERKESMLAPRPTPKLEDHSLSVVRDCLFKIFAATLHNGGRSSIRNLRTLHAVETGIHLSRNGAVTQPPLYALMVWIGARLPFFTSFASTLFAFHVERALTNCHAFVWRDACFGGFFSWY